MRKLTDSDKQEILKLYRESAETTSTLAERYGVSNSTISRLLKSTLPEDEYEYLVSLKRAARTPEGRAQVSYQQQPFKPEPPEPEEVAQPKPVKAKPSKPSISKAIKKSADVDSSGTRRVRRRSSAVTQSGNQIAEQLELLEPESPEIEEIPSPLLEDEDNRIENQVIAEMLGEDLLTDEEELEDFDDDDDDEEFEETTPILRKRISGSSVVQVLPLSTANLPRTCYLVIDRSAELITKPLKDFADLGQIPNLETLSNTLPVFDNHRVAKRFSTKRDRVIKVPDSKMLHKTRYHLNAKGITRLLIDGQVYSLA
ncbi:transposase [Calothrix rhizosoleniae]|uniref:transposase n=1 Tax=Calothrix rhizosoleniae TaxID=888997 RepID=UPI00190E929F|nr:transposase [Calothrix rhizosoleniae]